MSISVFTVPLNTYHSLLQQIPFSFSVWKQCVAIPLLLFVCFPQSKIKINQTEKKIVLLYVYSNKTMTGRLMSLLRK